ncbi:MAG: acetyl-CoA carboxylase biotin carboxyl carrier protein [Planctomycetota bacterium]|jgi:acetyl-CoA carboxylase biotin carboxyl carrier protein
MKVMNEIKAETGGTIVEICCKDGEAIEFGQTLLKVRP